MRVYSVRGQGIYGGGLAIIAAANETEARQIAKTIRDETWHTRYGGDDSEIAELEGVTAERAGVVDHFETGE